MDQSSADEGLLAPDVQSDFIRSLRAEIASRVQQQQQVAVAAGASIAVAASLLGDKVDPSPWLVLGLSLLFLAFGFTMLNQDRLIIAAATFILDQDCAEATIQRRWEMHLRSYNRDLGRLRIGTGAVLRAMSNYAIPVLGTIGAGWAYLADDRAAPAFIAIPATFALAFAIEAWEVTRDYQRLGNSA